MLGIKRQGRSWMSLSGTAGTLDMQRIRQETRSDFWYYVQSGLARQSRSPHYEKEHGARSRVFAWSIVPTSRAATPALVP